jgi:hypothetical protein
MFIVILPNKVSPGALVHVFDKCFNRDTVTFMFGSSIFEVAISHRRRA